eukprot:5229319-Amphidinium_carterae.1
MLTARQGSKAGPVLNAQTFSGFDENEDGVITYYEADTHRGCSGATLMTPYDTELRLCGVHVGAVEHCKVAYALDSDQRAHLLQRLDAMSW